jgi:hypothetical protein
MSPEARRPWVQSAGMATQSIARPAILRGMVLCPVPGVLIGALIGVRYGVSASAFAVNVRACRVDGVRIAHPCASAGRGTSDSVRPLRDSVVSRLAHRWPQRASPRLRCGPERSRARVVSLRSWLLRSCGPRRLRLVAGRSALGQARSLAGTRCSASFRGRFPSVGLGTGDRTALPGHHARRCPCRRVGSFA